MKKNLIIIFLLIGILLGLFVYFKFFNDIKFLNNKNINFLPKDDPSFYSFYLKFLKSQFKDNSYKKLFDLYSNFLIKEHFSLLNIFLLYLKNPNIFNYLEEFLKLFNQMSLVAIFPEENEELNFLLSFLGENSQKNYLIIFQDPLIERPSGGIFLAYAFLKIDKNTYEIKGSHIIDFDLIFPKNYLPYPILSSFSDALMFHDLGWYLDMILNREILEIIENQFNFSENSFDGLIFVNLDSFKNLLEITGPFKVKNKEINSLNVVSVLRENLFLGFKSYQSKDSSVFFDSFLKETLNKIKDLDEEKLLFLAQFLKESTEKKDIQIVFKEEKMNQFLKKKKLILDDFSFFDDYIGIAFVSNKENKENNLDEDFSFKKLQLNSHIFKEKTENQLLISFKNDYYLKIYLPEDVTIEKVENCFLRNYLKNSLNLSFWPASYDRRTYDLEKKIEIYKENEKTVIGCYGQKNKEVKIIYSLNKGEDYLKEKGKWQIFFQKQSGQNVVFSYNLENYNQLGLRPTLFPLNKDFLLEKDLEVNFYLNPE